MKKIKQILAAALLSCAFSAFADTATNVLKLGHITVENGVAKYKNATVTGSGTVSAISVHVDKGSIITTDIGAPTYTDTLEAHQTGIWTYSPALTTSEAQSKVTSLSFNYVEGMTITIDVDSNTISIPAGVAVTQFTPEVAVDSNGNKIPGSGGTPHYYMFVPYTKTQITNSTGPWTSAYNLAKTYTFLGMKGYLATITSLAEDKVLDAITSLGGWAGAARTTTTDISCFDTDSYSNLTYGGTTVGSCTWNWVCGPEAGYGVPTTTSKATKTPVKGAYTTYQKWGNNQPDGGSTSTDIGEAYFQVHFNDYWNDLTVAHNAWSQGYFVEFSDYKKIDGYTTPASVALQSCQVYDTTNGQDYSSIAEAVANASNGDILELMADQVVSEQDTADKNLVINTNGHKITGSFAVSSGSLTINAEDAKVDLTALKVSGGEFTIEKITCGTVTVTGGKLAINGTKDTVSLAKAAVSDGEFTLKGATFASTDEITSNVLVEGGTFTVDGLVTIPSLTLAQGNKVVFGENASSGSEITLSSTLPTGIITSGFGARGFDIGNVINLPTGVTDYLLIKTKTGELKIKQHSDKW